MKESEMFRANKILEKAQKKYNKDLIIIYSKDDNGYYAQDPNNDWKTSQIFFTMESLKYAIDHNLIDWE